MKKWCGYCIGLKEVMYEIKDQTIKNTVGDLYDKPKTVCKGCGKVI